MGDFRAIVSDLDGTFWWGEQSVHATTLPAVAELRRRGVEVLFATGRRLASTAAGLRPLDLMGPAVVLSGSIGADLVTGEEWHRAAMPAPTALAVWDAFADEGLVPVVHVSAPDLDAVVPPGCSTTGSHLRHLGHPVAGDPRPALESGRVVGFGICGLPPSAVAAGERAVGRIGDVAAVWAGPDHVHGGWTVMAGPAGVSKVTGIEGWVATRGIAPTEVLAVGDGSNDVEMLGWAGLAVAVEGGAAEAAGADHVIAAPQAGGWADLLDLV